MPRSPNPIFYTETSEMDSQEIWEHFEQCLDQHDWSYQYSDDQCCWKLGYKEQEHILDLISELGSEAYDKYNERKPEEC